MKKPFSILLCTMLWMQAHSQEPDVFIRGSYEGVPLSSFIRETEEQAGLQFFYRDEWISGITVTAEGDSMSLRKILHSSLSRTDLYFYLDSLKRVILVKGRPLVTDLTQPEQPASIPDQIVNGRNGYVTETEKSYLEGRKKIKAETLVIGDAKNAKPGKMIAVRGRLTDRETGEPLIGATAYVRETGVGYASDFDGQFLITLPAGTYDVTFNCLGMEEVNYYLTLYADGPLNIEMNRKLIPLDEVKITADRFHNVRGTQMGYEHITLKTIKEIPVVLGERDVLKVAQMLPGVQTMGEGTSGFNVRGSGADQNMFFINKTPVYNTSHLLGFFSAFNPDLVKDFTLYKSNIPARYGGRLSSIFILNSPRGNKKKLTARGGISPITGHIMVEGPLKKEKHSFILAARSTYSDWLLTRLDNPELRSSHAAFYDLAGHLNFEPNEKNTVRVFGYYSHDKFAFSAQNQHYLYDNKGASADWKHQWRPNLTSEIALIASGYDFHIVDSSESSVKAYQHGYSIGHYEFRADFVWIPVRRHVVTFGLNSVIYRLDRGTIKPAGPLSDRRVTDLGTEKGIESALYLADEFEISRYLTFSLGLRYSFYGMPGPSVIYNYNNGSPREELYIADTIRYSGRDMVAHYAGPELRGSLNLRTGEQSSVKLSYNKTRQYLFMLSNTLAVSPADQWISGRLTPIRFPWAIIKISKRKISVFQPKYITKARRISLNTRMEQVLFQNIRLRHSYCRESRKPMAWKSCCVKTPAGFQDGFHTVIPVRSFRLTGRIHGTRSTMALPIPPIMISRMRSIRSLTIVSAVSSASDPILYTTRAGRLPTPSGCIISTTVNIYIIHCGMPTGYRITSGSTCPSMPKAILSRVSLPIAHGCLIYTT